jgi:hypothetical protein
LSKPRPVAEEVVLQNLAAIRAGVQGQLQQGAGLSALAVLIREREGRITVEVVRRKAVRVRGAAPPAFEAAVDRVTKDDRDRLPILINLPITRTVMWFDYDAFERTGDLAAALARAASSRRSN